MAISIKHAFQSAKGDGGDATLVRPSNWNAEHNTSMATGRLLGRLTAGAGVFEEIPISPYVASILNAADATAFLAALGIGAFRTGDIKPSFNPTPDAGWILSNNLSIGSAASGATGRASADTLPLYTLLWNSISQTYAAVAGGRGANATADFNANKVMSLPWNPGRALIGAGSGGGLTARAVGEFGGAETHPLTVAELAAHFHSAGISDPSHNHTYLYPGNTGNTGGGGPFGNSAQGNVTSTSTTGVRVNSPNGLDTTYSTGSGTAHNNMQPWIAVWMHLKL